MTEIRVFKENEKLDEAFEILTEKINAICKQYQLNYYDLFGLLECFKRELFIQLDKEDDTKHQ